VSLDRPDALGVLLAGRAEFLVLPLGSFPPEPIPQSFFWSEGDEAFQPDIPMGLQTRLSGRRWPEVKLNDWLMVGAPPCIARRYLEPSVFVYYLPSLFVGVFDDLPHLDWVLEGIIPFNKTHTPRGKWWARFDACISESQRAALRSFLRLIRSTSLTDLRDQALLFDAEAIWGS